MSLLSGHPTTWIGKTVKSARTGDTFKILKVEKKGSRYSVKFDSDNDWFRYLGLDSRTLKDKWTVID